MLWIMVIQYAQYLGKIKKIRHVSRSHILTPFGLLAPSQGMTHGQLKHKVEGLSLGK